MMIDIDMQKFADFITAEDLAGAVQMVLSAAAEYIQDMDNLYKEVTE